VKRRQILGAASAGLAAALWPAWLREAFGDTPACEAPGGAPPAALTRVATLASALRRAREAVKPLLVLVIPAEDIAKYGRGRSFGELLNFGSDVQLAPLARADVVCATMADLRKLVPNAGAGEPLMVLVSTQRVPATARQLDAALEADGGGRMTGDSWEESAKRDDLASDRRIAQMAGLLREALGADDAHAATLAAEVRKRLKEQPPAGTRWANSSGCGITIEGDDDNMAMGCGMGHVPRKSRRFLYFFTKRLL
jgi:hypothetical protein